MKWIAPAIAVGLAVLSAGLGQVAQAQILAKPDQAITFIVEEGLPYGITQEAVDAAAATQAYSYEGFTVMVVGRELTWDESQNGELPSGVDVMLSVGFDEEDIDVVLPDASRVSVGKVAALDDSMIHFRLASDVRETYINNLTQSHGASAVIGAALTAATGAFDGGTRSPIFWVSIAALPLLIGLLIMVLWAHGIARERARKRTFSRARLHLARVVLELDVLEAQVLIAGAELDRATDKAANKVAAGVKAKLHKDLSAIRTDSLDLAYEEQLLTRAIVDPQADVHERGKPKEPMELDKFAAATDALRRRTSALIAASSLRVGHTGGGDVLGQIALSTTLALDELLKRPDRITEQELEALQRHRGDLLALVQEAETSFGTDSTPDVIVAHSDLLQRWRKVEQNVSDALAKLDRRLRRQAPGSRTAQLDADAIKLRVQERTQIASGGTLTTMAELRASFDLTPRDSISPSEHAERVLLIIEAIDGSAAPTAPSKEGTTTARRVKREASRVTPVSVMLVPIVVALTAGFIATSTVDADDKTYGKTLTGAEPLAALHILGDPALLPDFVDGTQPPDGVSNIDTLTLEQVRQNMESAATHGELALLPERVELIVALLPIEDYVEAQPSEESEDRIVIDFLELLSVYPRIKSEVAAQYPEVIDPVIGDVKRGYAILPLWIAEDGTYGAGLPLTGVLSTGVESRLGAYYFVATEVLMANQPAGDLTVPAGWSVAMKMSDLGREMEYNNLRKQTLEPSVLYWTVAIATWTGVQALFLIGWSVTQLMRRGAGTRSARKALRELRAQLNKLALGLDLSLLDAVAVLGNVDGHGGKAAEADQTLYETMLFTAWREVEELESLPRRMQRGPEWRARVERMRAVITSLAERDTTVADRALNLIRTYS